MNTAAVPVIEYRIETTCGRIFSWSAPSPESAMFELKRDKLLSTAMIMPYAQWEALQDGFDGYEQLELNAEYEKGDAA